MEKRKSNIMGKLAKSRSGGLPVTAYKATGLVVKGGTPLMLYLCNRAGAADAADIPKRIEASCYIGGHLVVMCSATVNAKTALIKELGIEKFPEAVFGTIYVEVGRFGGYSNISDTF